MPEITGPVGQGVPHSSSDDVITIQTLLKKAGNDPGKIDGRCGPKTISAIVAFQSKFLSAPDGRVDRGGLTWKKLTAEALSLVQLPQVSGFGYYSFSPVTRQYGTADTIQALRDVAASFRLNASQQNPGATSVSVGVSCTDRMIGIGDISFQNGGPMDPHATHQKGTNTDIRPLRTDKKQSPVSITDAEYSSEDTSMLVKCLLAHKNVRRILFNDTSIQGVTFFVGHHNHLHVEMRS
jgi:peptidoglycan hydrolase-like protein with peptidoglycan-binding domain